MAEQVFHIGVKALVRDDAGRVLLVRETKHEDTYWDIPGGRMEPGEDLFTTLARELQEEIGVGTEGGIAHFMTVLSNKQIQTADGPVALMLVVYEVKLDRGKTPQPNEKGLMLDWQTADLAGRLLADKYPKHFCEAIRKLTERV